jgi:hypothetical protein
MPVLLHQVRTVVHQEIRRISEAMLPTLWTLKKMVLVLFSSHIERLGSISNVLREVTLVPTRSMVHQLELTILLRRSR